MVHRWIPKKSWDGSESYLALTCRCWHRRHDDGNAAQGPGGPIGERLITHRKLAATEGDEVMYESGRCHRLPGAGHHDSRVLVFQPSSHGVAAQLRTPTPQRDLESGPTDSLGGTCQQRWAEISQRPPRGLTPGRRECPRHRRAPPSPSNAWICSTSTRGFTAVRPSFFGPSR